MQEGRGFVQDIIGTKELQRCSTTCFRRSRKLPGPYQSINPHTAWKKLSQLIPVLLLTGWELKRKRDPLSMQCVHLELREAPDTIKITIEFPGHRIGT